MRSRYQVIKNNGVYFITSTIIEWIPVFTKKEYFDIIVQSLSYCRQTKGLKLFTYVVMDNHVHLIVSAHNISLIMKDFKSYTAREIIKTAQTDDRKWLLNQLVIIKDLTPKNSGYNGVNGRKYL